MTLKWKPPKLPPAATAQYANTAEHAVIVHQGARLRNGGVIYARKFMTRSVSGQTKTNKFIAAEVFADAFKESESFPKAFRVMAQAGQKRIKQAFSDKWTWPAGQVTHRRNGTSVTTPRNIIDTGELKTSQQSVRFLP